MLRALGLAAAALAAHHALAQADGDCTGPAQTLTWECGGMCDEYIPCLVYNASDCEASSAERSASCTNDADSVCAYTCFTNFYSTGAAYILIPFGSSSSSSSSSDTVDLDASSAWVYDDAITSIGVPSISPLISAVQFQGGSNYYMGSNYSDVTVVDGFQILNDTITKVTLSGIDLTEMEDLLSILPEGISDLTVSGTGLTSFAAGDGQGANITSITMGSNAITKFSGSFPALTYMTLSVNSLTDFSGDFPLLSMLVLVYNSLPSFSGSFPALTSLDIRVNRLTEFSGDFPSLTSLDLGSNALTNFSISLPALTSLSLYNNLLTSFSGDFSVLTSLYLSDNSIAAFSGEYPVLTTLDLKNNSLSNFTGDFPALTSLTLTNNSLTKVPDNIFDCVNLTTLYLSGNPYEGMPTFTRSQVTFLQGLSEFNLTAADFAEAADCGDMATATINTFTICVSDEVTESSNSGSSGGISGGAIAGIVVAVAVVVIVVVGFLVWRRRSRTFGKGGSVNQDLLTAELTQGSDIGGLWNDEQLQSLRVDARDIEDVRKIGSGAFGEVWLVRYQSTQLLASKRLIVKHEGGAKRQEGGTTGNQSTQSGSLHRFVEEIKLVATLDHINIVAFRGVAWTFHSDIQALFEYMENGDLRDYLVQNKPNSQLDTDKEKLSAEAFKLQVACDIVDALVYVHSFAPPVVHRDLKSRNVLLSSEWRAKVTDFGCARVQSENATMTAGVGTGRWLAPEVLTGSNDYGTAADIFAFGAMLSELDTHMIPYDDARSADGKRPLANVAILQLVAEGKLRPTFSAVCRPEVKELALRCMAQAPEDRPAAALVAYELRQFVKSAHAEMEA